jgi:hypothetical protein
MKQSRVPYMDTVRPPHRKLSAYFCTFLLFHSNQAYFFRTEPLICVRLIHRQDDDTNITLGVYGLETQRLYRPKNRIYNVP